MIKKLQNKILLIIFLAISIPLIILVSLSTYSYYSNTIRSVNFMINRVYERKGLENKEVQINEINGVYYIKINGSNIIDSSDNMTDEINEYALIISNKNKEEGIINNYIYKIRKQMNSNNIYEIYLVESSDSIKSINVVIVVAITFTCLMIGLIYLLSWYISKLIIKPVEDTFDKQVEFISDASHELKTPLAVIQANADVLEGEIGNNKWLSYIQNETDNMSKLINEMLLLTKNDNIDSIRKPEEFNLSDEINFVTSSFESMAYEKEVNIKTDIDDNIITNKFNKDDIDHILSTLIDNAIKHTDKKKKVMVEMKKYKDHITINIKNEGEEIPIEEREKIFDRFYRIDKSRNRNEKRYGLGLAIAKSMVLKNNGTISVDCRDGITNFIVNLPL